MPEAINMFAALTKVDEAQHRVSGVLAQEVLDRVGEVFDYDSSKKHFVAWSEGFAKATQGKSVGNLREMHRPEVVGKFVEMTFDDATKAILVTAQVEDDAAWKKVASGCYTGFSIGGRYERKWNDQADETVKRYEAVPAEGSLVDLPCMPTAMFTMVRADGASELVKFDSSVAKLEAEPEYTAADAAGLIDAMMADAETADDRAALTSARNALSEPAFKGDFAGHPFRGNQHVGGSGSDRGHKASRAAHEASQATKGKGSSKETHEAAAAAHAKAAAATRKAGREGAAQHHEQMASYHSGRAARFGKVAEAAPLGRAHAGLSPELLKFMSLVAPPTVIDAQNGGAKIAVVKMDPRIESLTAEQADALAKALPELKTPEEVSAWLDKVAARADADPQQGKKEYGDVEFADAKNKKYPIDTVPHIRAAWNYINKAKNAAKYSADDVGTIKGKIVSAWKAKIDKDGPPSAAENAKTIVELALTKGLYTVASLAQYAEGVHALCQGYQWEQEMEGDKDSVACERLEQACDLLLEALELMASEETQELRAGGDADAMAMAAGIAGLRKSHVVKTPIGLPADEPVYTCPPAWPEAMRKAAFDQLKAVKPEERAKAAQELGMTVTKVGARHSKEDKDHLQAIHDHCVGMGADCPGAKGDDADKAAKAELQKRADEGAALAKLVEDGTPAGGTVAERAAKALADAKSWRDAPAPAKVAATAVEKVIGAQSTPIAEDPNAPVLKADGTVDGEKTALKLIKSARAAAHA